MSAHTISIAVLPFENLSPSPPDSWLAVGFVQDLIAEIARFPTLGVISAQSTFAADTAGLADAAIGRCLGVEYLLKGSVRKLEKAIRISVQLVQLEDGRNLWGEHYDVREDDLFALQDEIAAKIANALSARIDQSMLSAAKRHPPATLKAYECWLRGLECLQRGTAESDNEARGFFELALETDPQYARAHGGLSLSHFNEWSCQAWNLWEEKEKLAYEHALQAEALDPDDQIVQVILGRIEQYRRDFDKAGVRLERAWHLAPNDAFALIQLSLCFTFQGDPVLGQQLAKRALDLSPLCPSWYFYCAALPLFALKRYDEAVLITSKGGLAIVDSGAYLAASHAYLGNRERAKFYLGEFHKNFVQRITFGREPEPGEAMRWLVHVNPYRREEDRDHFIKGMQLAGLDAKASALRSSTPVSWPIGNIFRREGELWTVSFDHQVVQVTERRGFLDIAQLLAHPCEEIHCAVLCGQPVAAGRGVSILDEQARRAYRERIREIEEGLAEAERDNDSGRYTLIREEKEQLIDELRKATGLGGRERKMGDSAERARSAVTWRVRDAIKKLEAIHPSLARHLANSIRTGLFCSYNPEKPTGWFV
ncbi:MAG TPA: hypothetical protein VIS96_04250 [Terrimicrobiaceae bacterium]